MAIATFKRCEIKFLLNTEQFTSIIAKLPEYMEPDKFCCDGRDYTIGNIYYDTPDNYLIRKSLEKPNYKAKLRLRSYGIPASPEDKVFLELKKKTAGIIHKRRAVMTLKEAYAFTAQGQRPAASDYINEQVIKELAYFLSCYKVSPAVYIGYHRIAFLGKEDKNFRVTFDYDITTRRENLLLEKDSPGEKLLEDGRYLMEVKVAGAVPLWLAEELAALKIYKTSFSKYGTEYLKYCYSRKSSEKNKLYQHDVLALRPQVCVSY